MEAAKKATEHCCFSLPEGAYTLAQQIEAVKRMELFFVILPTFQALGRGACEI